MFKVIAKTALKALIIAVLFVSLAFGVLSLGYPLGMASFFEHCGNYSFASGYASLNYKYTGKLEDLDRCFYDCSLASDDGDIIYFGETLLSKHGFDEYGAARGEELGINYKHYVCGCVAAAKYRQGDKAEALETAKSAFEAESGFPNANALVKLLLEAQTDTVYLENGVKPAVLEITPLGGQADYYNRVISIIDGLIT